MVCKRWLDINEEVVCKKMLSCTDKITVKKIWENLYSEFNVNGKGRWKKTGIWGEYGKINWVLFIMYKQTTVPKTVGYIDVPVWYSTQLNK
jgi:hypothetical protein